jgi:hypothetical protein
MPRLTVQQIRSLAREIVARNAGGIRYSQLLREISSHSPETSLNTIQGSIWDLHAKFPNEITKPSRGLFKPAGVSGVPGAEEIAESTVESTPQGRRIQEQDFYEPFAEWLKNDLDEVTVVASLGGSGLRAKWGTPDVVGAYKPLASNIIKFPLEVVAAEIKIDRAAPVVAFGQAISYRLFSSKTYIAMPTTLTEEDQSRLEALCMLFGVGLVLFDLDPDRPNFVIRVRAQRFSPDMFYVNEFADRLRAYDGTIFEHIFG